MEYPQLCILIIAVLTLPTDVCCQGITASQNPLPVGNNVTLQLSPQATIIVGTWSFQTTTIVLWYPGGVIISDAWQNRTTFNQTSSQLSIGVLKVEDSGLYILQGLTPNLRAEFTLSIQEPISNVSLSANKTHLVELNDTAVLTCSVSNGSSLSYLWVNGSSEVKANVVQIGNAGATLTIPSVTRYDQGPFRCNVSNGISSGISQSVSLNISYGPSDPTLTVVPMKAAYQTGSNITLLCSAASNPPPVIQWVFEGRYLNQYGSKLSLDDTNVNQTGNYKCLVNNPVTLRFTSMNTTIRIVDPISAVQIKVPLKPPVDGSSFNLSCDVTGPVVSIQWRKNSLALMSSNKTVFSMDNNTVTLNPVLPLDNGDYQCEAFNAVSNMTSSPYRVIVNYGPENPVIDGPSMAMTGRNVTFNCSASSQPPSSYKWFFNGSQVAMGSEFTTGLLNLNSSGTFTCMAYNNVTGKNSTAQIMITVIDPVVSVSISDGGKLPVLNGSFTMTCNVIGDPTNIFWWRNGLPFNGANFTTGKRTATLEPVRLSDNGEYECEASNAVSTVTSPAYMVLVNYGPDNTVINGPTAGETGSSVTFCCSASSQPPSSYQWFFNGSQIADGSQYVTVGPLTYKSSGMYSCVAYNNITTQNSTADTMLSVVEAIESVMVNASAVPIAFKQLTLTCEITGPYNAVYWLKDNTTLNVSSSYQGSNTSLYNVNNTLYFNPLTLSDDGVYQCVATNQFGPHTSSEYELLVNYGPLQVNISGPSSAVIGSAISVTLTCIADSYPISMFTWLFNNQSVAMGADLGVYVQNQSTGNYTCIAANPVTNIALMNTFSFTVIGHASTIPLLSRIGLTVIALLALSLPVINDWLLH